MLSKMNLCTKHFPRHNQHVNHKIPQAFTHSWSLLQGQHSNEEKNHASPIHSYQVVISRKKGHNYNTSTKFQYVEGHHKLCNSLNSLTGSNLNGIQQKVTPNQIQKSINPTKWLPQWPKRQESLRTSTKIHYHDYKMGQAYK